MLFSCQVERLHTFNVQELTFCLIQIIFLTYLYCLSYILQGHPGKNDETNWPWQIDEKRPRETAMPLNNTDFEEIGKKNSRFPKLPTVLDATLYIPAWRIQLRARKGLKMIRYSYSLTAWWSENYYERKVHPKFFQNPFLGCPWSGWA